MQQFKLPFSLTVPSNSKDKPTDVTDKQCTETSKMKLPFKIYMTPIKNTIGP